MGKLSGAIAAFLFGAHVSCSTPIHPRLDTNDVAQRAANDNETPSSFYVSLAANGVHAEHRMDMSFRFFKGVHFQVKILSANLSGTDTWNLLRQMQDAPQIRNI
jgi:hypothetical protein